MVGGVGGGGGGGGSIFPVISFVLTWVPSPQPCPLDFQHRVLWQSCPLALPAWAWSCSDSAASLPQGRWCHRNDPWCSGLQEGHQGRLASHVCRQENGDYDVEHLFHEASMTFHSKDHVKTINIYESTGIFNYHRSSSQRQAFGGRICFFSFLILTCKNRRWHVMICGILTLRLQAVWCNIQNTISLWITVPVTMCVPCTAQLVAMYTIC